eukprot:sb/3466720/
MLTKFEVYRKYLSGINMSFRNFGRFFETQKSEISADFLTYKSISEAHEEALKEMSQSEQSAKCDTAEQFTRMSGEIESLTASLESTETQRRQLQAQYDTLFANSDKSIRDLKESLAKTETQLQEAKQRETTATSLEREVRSQFSNLNSLYDSSQNSLTEQREKVVNLEGQVTQLQSEIVVLSGQIAEQTQLRATTESKHSEETQLWEAERVRVAGELGTVTQKSEDLESQNTLLHTQLDSLSKEVQQLQRAITSDQTVLPAEGEEKSSEELWEIIRRPKHSLTRQIALTKFAMADVRLGSSNAAPLEECRELSGMFAKRRVSCPLK